MSLKQGKLLALLALAALFAVEGIYLLSPDHDIVSYIKCGYPPWLHILAGVSLLASGMLLPFRRSRWLGAVIGCCFIVLETAITLLHGDFAHTAHREQDRHRPFSNSSVRDWPAALFAELIGLLLDR